jgi:hypothetical protein
MPSSGDVESHRRDRGDRFGTLIAITRSGNSIGTPRERADVGPDDS